MNDQNLKAAERMFVQVEPEPAISDHEKERVALYANKGTIAC